ncbi:spore maturation protein CgeB [Dichotomicrobium thermohalophilum]|uniref:Spore maturation protein CgeB n=2 Tax=Dichotomicrobium thermohalophilum TaxID=933063 RepID=A0A397Q931_9HYPH|nr:spore maturation protein CgeB [Dichotomicrobium thermohalophilum]
MEKNTASALRTSTDGCKARIKNGVSIYPTQLRNARPQNIQKNTIPLSLRQPQWAEKLSKPTKQLRIACILDDFSHICFSREAEFLQLGATNTLNELENFQPDLLFVESAWQGRDGTWDRKIGQRSQELHDSIEWCRNRDIPTVFWNKEDPVHFATFLNTAALFDFVFTTDIDCIARYKSELGHDNVFLLPFGCQPEIHNPIEEYQRKDAICFAGAYYARYPERMRDFEEFMEKLPPKIPLEIYDRNFGKDHPDYAFPERFDQYIMGTLPANQIGIAYKGYRYALNMNSIKRSQTMFARRVVELLASNTIVISNYSRALRILFGDLIVATDSGSEALKQLEQLSKKPDREERFRLAGLRKVMKEHTYQSRLEYIVSCVTNTDRRSPLPRFCVFSRVETCDEASRVISTFERQRGVEAKLTVVAPSSLEANNLPKCSKQVKIVSLDDVSHQSLSDFAGDDVEWIAAMVPDDHYGPNYLLDIALATRYARDKEVIGKTEYYTYEGGKAIRNSFAAAYKSTGKLAARRSAISKDAADRINAREWISKLEGWQYELPEQFAIDPFNYCQGGNVATHRREVSDVVDDIDLDTGVTLESLLRKAENISVGARETAEIESLDGGELAELFGTGRAQDIHTTTTEDGWTITSDLSDGKHTYIYAPTPVNTTWLRSKCKKRNRLKCHLDADAGLDISFVMEYFDAENNRIDHSILPANRNHTVKLPIEAATAKLGLRILGPGEARINELHFDHIDFSGAPIATARHLIVTNHYPSYDDIYRNGFVHRRVVSYKNAGVNVDVFRLRVKERLSFHEFHGVDVITGGKEDLQRLIENGHYESIIVHFLDPDMWSVLRQFCRNTRIVVWVHGFEIQPWWRRSFNYETKKHLKRAKSASEDRINFWKDIFSNYQDDLHFTFVSRHFANEVMEDYDLPLPASRYSVIHNPIDTELFRYEPKEASQRLRILAIGPYMSRKYANDLSVEAILALRDKPFFSDLEFRIIGDGKLFEETLAPLRGLDNVTIERRFLTQPEIAELHKEYGVFLCPTRWDSQGVSRDEAMSSGLVPVTNAVAAVPEFVDESCGFMAPPEDAAGLAAAIETLYHDPERFLAMSEAAAARVRRQSAAEEVIKKELELFASNSTSTASN